MKRFFQLAIAAVIIILSAEGAAQSKGAAQNKVAASECLAVIAESITIEEQSAKEGDSAQIVMSIDTQGIGSSIKICEGRLRISYKGENVVILTLDKKVKIAPRNNQKVRLGLRVSYAKNSHALAFKEAVKRGDLGDTKIDWMFDVKGGLRHHKVEQVPTPITDIVAADQIEKLQEWLTKE